MEAKAVADVQSLAFGSPYLNLEPSVFVTRIPSPRPACALLSENCASRGSLGARPGMRQTCVFLAHMKSPSAIEYIASTDRGRTESAERREVWGRRKAGREGSNYC